MRSRQSTQLTLGSGGGHNAFQSGNLSNNSARGGAFGNSKTSRISRDLTSDGEALRRKLMSCGSALRDKLFLASYDIMSVNLSSPLIYQFYVLIDFVFLAAFPLNHIYNYSRAANQAVNVPEDGNMINATLGVPSLTYLIPTDALYDRLPFSTNLKVAYCLVAFILAVALTLVLLVATRSRQRLATESPERKLVNKGVGLVLCVTYFLVFVPITTFSSPFLLCSKEVQQANLVCYEGEHLTIFCFVVLALILHLLLIMYSSFMLTTNYPHELIPWGHFPSNAPFYKLLARFPIVLVYQLDTLERNTLVYFNIGFALLMCAFIQQRLTKAMTFDHLIHYMQVVSEAVLSLLFLTAFLADVIPQINPLSSLFTISLVLILCAAGYFVTLLQESLSERFIMRGVDIFSYTSETEALRMMFALNRLIVVAAERPREEFVLRGFVERHIEICDYSGCNCLEYYKVINSGYRLQLATVASMKDDPDPNSTHKEKHAMRQQQSQNTQNPRGSNTQRILTTDDDQAANYSGDDSPSLLGGTSSGSGPQARLFFLDGTSTSAGAAAQRQNKARARFLHTFLINNIKVFIELFPNSLKLRYMSAYIYYSLFKNSFKALYELSYNNNLLSSVKGANDGMEQSIGSENRRSASLAFLCGCGNGGDAYNSYTLGLRIIEHFSQQVGQFLSKESKIVDMECDLAQIIEFEKLNIKYQKSIERTSEISEQFWMELSKKGGLNIDTIFNLGALINQRFHQIKRLYRRLMSINQNYLEVAYLYKLFVQLCLNFELEESEAKLEITKILQSKGMRKRNLRLEYAKINFQDENGMIIISGCQRDFSQILAMNNKAERIFGYSTAELIDQPLQKLQPYVYAKSPGAGGPTTGSFHSAHDDFIMNYINSQKRRRIRKEQHRFVWGKHKTGFIMPIVMDISPYVTYEHNLCFISFCKRSILLEMTPLKEIIDAQDVFVLLADQRGVITDMTRNVTDWLGFPQSAMQRKEISLEQVFDGILEEENEKDFSDGKRIDFFMNSFKDAMDDYENRSEPDLLAGSGANLQSSDPMIQSPNNGEIGGDIGMPPGGGTGEDLDSTLYMKDKKCRALVWMKVHEYPLCPQGGVNPTSIASPTNGFVSFQGQIVNHSSSHQLSVREIWFVLLEEEAATATATASIMDSKNTHDTAVGGAMEKEELKFTYQEDREEISSLASISSLAGYNSTDKGLINKLSEIKTSTVEDQKPQAISFLQQALVGVFILSVVAAIVMLAFSLTMTSNFYKDLQFVTSATFATISYQNLQILTRDLISFANQEQSEFSLFQLPKQPIERQSLTQAFLQRQISQQAEKFRNLLLDIDDHNFLQSEPGKVMNKEFKQKRVQLQYLRQDGLIYQDKKTYLLSIYELINSWMAISRQSQLPALSLQREMINTMKSEYPNPILSDLNMTQRQVYFILNNSRQADLNYYPMRLGEFLIEQARTNLSANSNVYLIITIIASAITFMTCISVIPIIVRIESNKEKVFFIYAELSRNDIDDRKRNIRVFFAKLRQSTQNPGGSLFYEKSSRIVSSKLVTRRFSMRDGEMNSGHLPPNAGGGGASGKGLSRMSGLSGGMNAGGGLVRQNVRGLGGTSRGTSQESASGMRSRMAIGSLLHGGDVDYEEDLQAEIMKQKEEQEAAAFKRFFHSRIQHMSCMKKIKHVALVLLIAAVVCAYFLVKRTMIQNIEETVRQSIDHYKVFADRDQYFGQLISEYRESFARNLTFPSPDKNGSSIDYFLNQTLNNELQYNRLRQSLPDILGEARSLISNIEGENLCNVTIGLQFNSSKDDASFQECQNVIDGVMKTGVTQIINSLIKEIVQSQINFDRTRRTQAGLRQVIANNKIRGIIYIKIIYLDSVLEHLVSKVQTSITDYIYQRSLSLIILFISFFFVLLVGVTITATFGMDYLLRNFNATKSILNFIPGKCLIELSDKTELKKIQF